MTTTNTTSEEDLEAAFLDDPKFGLRLLCADFRDPIARYIRSRLWNVPQAEKAVEVKEVYQETMVAMAELVRKPDVDWRKPLKLAFGVARNKSVDAIRKRVRYKSKQDVDGALDRIAGDLAGTKIGLEWKLQSKIEWDEFYTTLMAAVGSVLTDKQAVVAHCYIDNYEDFGEREIYAPLSRLVSEITGNDENAMTIKKQWLEAKERLVDELIRKGFKFLNVEE